MKKLILFLLVASITLCVSCFGGETCTSIYSSFMKIDGKKGDKISIRYIGPTKRKYEKEFGFNSEYKIPFFDSAHANTICRTKDFQKHGYNFLEIKNLGTEPITITSVLKGPEVDDAPESRNYRFLFEIYHEQDIDPNFDYTKDSKYKDFKNYIPREELYKKLENEKYPYFVKLPPQKTCIVKWGNKGIQILN